MRLSSWSLLALGLVALTGTAAACEGLSPGDQMVTDAGLCTLAFILADANDLYFATAGHCIQVDQRASTPDHGEIGVGVFHFLEPETGSSSDGSPGMDFGLVRIHPEQYAKLNPKVCGWDGPVGLYEGGNEGGGVRHYGHGLIFGDLGPTTQQREGLFLFTDEQAFYWTGAGVPGDSGSAVLDESNLAVGVFTHVIAGVNGIPPADNGGTRLQRGLDLAAEAGFPDLKLVLAGEDPVAVMMAMRAAPPPPATPATPTSATPGAEPTTPPEGEPGGAPAAGEPGGEPAQNDSDISPAATNEAEDAARAPMPWLLALVAIAAVAYFRRR